MRPLIQRKMAVCVSDWLLVLLLLVTWKHVTSMCTFPSILHMEAKDPPWYSKVRADGSRDVEYYIRPNVMEVVYPLEERTPIRWKCSLEYQGKLLLKRQDHLVNSFFRCVQFVLRSRSVIQLMWSDEGRIFDPKLCEDRNLKLDPWPLIWYNKVEDDYSPCPFSGGFDMKIVDSELGENGCNFMLRPMRMEAECVGGEGVTFNFVSSNCIPDIRMYVKQRTLTLASWQDDQNHYVILRRNEEKDLWCLIMPINRGANVTAYLFSDLRCGSGLENPENVAGLKFFTLSLHKRVFPTLCEDEYDQCAKVSCNSYVRQECQKSCQTCGSSTSQQDCHFQKSFIGSWFLKDSIRFRNIHVTSSSLSIEGVGDFQCWSNTESTPGKASFATVSLYQNGCRPRYTCIRLHRLGPSVLQYSLGHSFVWPTFDLDLSKSICSNDRFHPDSSPIDDRFRSYEGTGKPIISRQPTPEAVSCNMSSVLTLSATLPQGYVCPGLLYQHCQDNSLLRLEFSTCETLISGVRDYRCLADFQGHYWERILLVQNLDDPTDAICFIFSQIYPIEAYVLPASECDQKGFNFARTGLRQPILKLTYRKELDSCKSAVRTTTPSFVNIAKPHSVAKNGSMGDIRNFPQPETYNSVSVVSGSQPIKMGQDSLHNLYKDHRDSYGVSAGDTRSTPVDARNSFMSSDEENSSPVFYSFKKNVLTVVTIPLGLRVILLTFPSLNS